ncbi:MAG: EAL domain-containing protein [Hyphomicrobiales bacterium]|jgi:diguanylate cyclase (GGDEF)-like protein/PAS domain S-box-containing protein|nr:EAL domain-containing protein [Hyphomicrobiales bacterium]
MPFIAILDDQFTNRQIFARLAASIADDVIVETFADPLLALEGLRHRTPDLVITDFKMPHMDGADFVRCFRELPGAADVPVVVLTVYEERSFRMRALECGATDFLQSPVDHQEFATRARNLLRLRKQQLLLAARAEQLKSELNESERTREHAMRDSRERLAQVIDSIPAVVRCTDLDGKVLFANAFQSSLLGKDAAAVVGSPISNFIGEEQAARSNALDRMVWETGRHLPSFEEEVIDAAHVRRVLLSSKTPLYNVDGSIGGILTTSIDISDRKAAENYLRHMAHHDTLTGLPNRVLLHERLTREITRSRRGDRSFALHLIDLDNFKSINDLQSHGVGDEFIAAIGQRLKDVSRRQDTVARIGGDEFAVLQSDIASAAEAGYFAQRLLGLIAEPYMCSTGQVTLTGSIGTTLHPADGADGATLLKNADTAMYRAKADGGNRASLYASDMQSTALLNAVLDSDMRLAMERKEFELYFQPQVNAVTGALVGGEALIRWNRPGMGLQSPGIFLPRAEATGFIVKLNDWVVMEACRLGKHWQSMGLAGVRVGVNLSPLQFTRQNVPLLVTRALAESGLEPRLLDLELTESSVLEDSDTLIAELEQIRILGCEISIDDFGTGYSSLRYVKRFPVDRLKIDQSFIRNLPGDPNDVAIVKTVIALGHSLDLAILAEGVENNAQAQFLAAEGCDEFQGFLYAQPLPFADFIAFAQDRMRGLKQA